jgi:NAD(P)-dependent dehydrogenase (short-subunit alcohol dehydrogenase family)
MAPLADTHVVVLGGSWGIGYAVAKAALTEGARVTIASSSASKIAAAAERLAKDIGGDASKRVRAEVLDLKDEAAYGPFFTKIGVVDHLVSTVSLLAWTGYPEMCGGSPDVQAGDGLIGGYPDLDVASIKSMFDVRYWSASLTPRLFHY